MFRVRKSNHSKKIVKQLKREYKEDLEKSGNVKQEIKSGLKTFLSDMAFNREYVSKYICTQIDTTGHFSRCLSSACSHHQGGGGKQRKQ